MHFSSVLVALAVLPLILAQKPKPPTYTGDRTADNYAYEAYMSSLIQYRIDYAERYTDSFGNSFRYASLLVDGTLDPKFITTYAGQKMMQKVAANDNLPTIKCAAMDPYGKLIEFVATKNVYMADPHINFTTIVDGTSTTQVVSTRTYALDTSAPVWSGAYDSSSDDLTKFMANTSPGTLDGVWTGTSVDIGIRTATEGVYTKAYYYAAKGQPTPKKPTHVCQTTTSDAVHTYTYDMIKSFPYTLNSTNGGAAIFSYPNFTILAATDETQVYTNAAMTNLASFPTDPSLGPTGVTLRDFFLSIRSVLPDYDVTFANMSVAAAGLYATYEADFNIALGPIPLSQTQKIFILSAAQTSS